MTPLESSPDSSLREFSDALSPKERLRILADWSRSEYGYLGDEIVDSIYRRAADVAGRVAARTESRTVTWEQRLDNLTTSRWLAFPLMFAVLGVVLWLTLKGANYPSELLAAVLFWLETRLTAFFDFLNAPTWLHGVLVLGTYRSAAWVVSVMLPPMAIFFPFFTLLEDLGYLPRVAFNLDRLFHRAGAHGKQSLTMCMGLGCNAAGVVSCRIIDSPREKLIALLTNNFIPCNGRFPLLITLAFIFMGGSTAGALVVAGLILVGIVTTLVLSWLLSRTLLRGESSSFILELPPFRRPQILRVLVRSILDRTLHVLGRAVTIAAPAGALTWVLANTGLGGTSLLTLGAGALDPLGRALGMDGFILMAFLLGLPANEIVLPILVMGYISAGTMADIGSLEALRSLLVTRGWTWLTALSTMLFSLLHYPCATTLFTIYRETGSPRWTALAALIPLGVAVLVTFVVSRGVHLLAG